MEEVLQRWERQPEMLGAGGGFAAYALVDEVVDGYLTVVEAFEDRADLLVAGLLAVTPAHHPNAHEHGPAQIKGRHIEQGGARVLLL